MPVVAAKGAESKTISRSGSIAVKNAAARGARLPHLSRAHDAELVEVWATICALRALSWSRCTAWMRSLLGAISVEFRAGPRAAALHSGRPPGLRARRSSVLRRGAGPRCRRAIAGHPFIDISSTGG